MPPKDTEIDRRLKAAREKPGTSALPRSARGSKASTSPAASHSGPSKKSSARPESDTGRFYWLRSKETGRYLHSLWIPTALDNVICALAKKAKVTPGEALLAMLRECLLGREVAA